MEFVDKSGNRVLDRRTVVAGAIGVGAVAAAPTALAQSNQGSTTELSAQDLMALMDNALWIPDGPNSDRHAYVIYAPWCGVCQRLYNQTRSRPSGLQLRWLPTSARDAMSAAYIAYAGATRTSAALDHTFGRRTAPQPTDPALAENIIRINFWAWMAFEDVVLRQTGRLAYPSVVVPTASGFQAHTGAPALSVLNAAVARPGLGARTPAGVALAATTRWRPERAPSRSGFAKADRTPGRSLPTLAAPVIEQLSRNRGGTIVSTTTVNGVRWIEIPSHSGQGIRGAFYRADDLFFQ